MPTLLEISEKLTGLQTQYKAKLDAAPKKKLADGSEARDLSAEDVKALRDMQAEMETLGKELSDLKAVEGYQLAEVAKREEAAANRMEVRAEEAPRQRKLSRPSDVFMKSEEFKNRRGARMDEVELFKAEDSPLFLKTTMTTSANGYPPEVLRDGDVVPLASRPPQLLDYLPMYSTTQNGIKFMKQTVRTNNAAARSENATLVEGVITYAESTDIISAIGTFIPVTMEELEDVPALRQLIDNDLMLMVRQVLDEQVTVGNGSAPNLRGIFNASSIQTQARGTDDALDALHKALVKVKVTGRANPNLFVLHSTDWQNIVLTRTADGVYILGNPTDGAAPRCWGLPVVQSEALTATNALVLDTNYFQVAMRSGVVAEIGEQNTDFVLLKQTIRAYVRAGLKKRRDTAACKITGLP